MSGDASPGGHNSLFSKQFLMVVTVVLVSVLSFLLGFYVGRTRDQFASPRLFSITGEPGDQQKEGGQGSNSPQDAGSAAGLSHEEGVAMRPSATGAPSPGQESAPRGQAGGGAAGRFSRYYVQVGAFSSLPDAVRVKSNLEQKGYNTHIETERSGRRELYKVRLGPYAFREQADRALAEIMRAGKEKPFLIVID